MRFYFLVATIFSGLLFSQAAPVDVVDGSGEAPDTLLQNTEEQPHQRLRFHNWDYKDLGTTAFEDIAFPARQPPAAVNQTEQCPDGWELVDQTIQTTLQRLDPVRQLCRQLQVASQFGVCIVHILLSVHLPALLHLRTKLYNRECVAVNSSVLLTPIKSC
ncbi:hypothetical protein CRE_30604 [Caenorhabditis remanei]|uniref:Uncharacterized protein n=1 Tax=Caenorhabditis remanei TaxID=31234 RepID=E3NSH6_CAERE|nr:hypothetical protein CRE_30604 [Caenorhabditis remanei]